ncbi:MAG: hypothetical protein R6X27_05880 [Candidatus Desulfacyla sp.]
MTLQKDLFLNNSDMFIDYLFSSPGGDIPLGPKDLARPFLIAPSEPHPFLTLGDYFETIKRFVLKDGGNCLTNALEARAIRENDLDTIKRIRIRSEKHGVLYHVASVEIFVDDRPVKFAVSTAVSNGAKSCLTNEYEIVRSLCRSLRPSYLPKIYEKGDVICQGGHPSHETLTLMLSEWFEDYHEWHFSMDETDNRQKICIWDLENGHRYASEEEAFEIFRQASRILTLYYDPHTFKQIIPWSHAAGDFVVKTGDDGIHVRLTTARGYRSIMDFFSEDAVHPMIAMAYFFLNLTVRMRLDRLNGVEETVWAGDFIVQAVGEGFFEALGIMGGKGMLTSNEIQECRSLLQSLAEDDLERLFKPLLALYQEESPDEFHVIHAHLKGHVGSLYRTLQGFRL